MDLRSGAHEVPGRDALRLRRFLFALLATAAVFEVLFLVGSATSEDPGFDLASAVVGAFVVVVAVARGQALRSPIRAAVVAGCAILVVSAAGTVALPFLYPAQIPVTVLAVTLVLPWLRGRPLAAFMSAAIGTAAFVVGIGAVTLPGAARWLLVANTTAATALVLALVWQFTERIRTGEARFRSLVEATSQIVMATDAGGGVIEDSPSWRAFTGQSVADILEGRTSDAVHPDDLEAIQGSWREAVARDQPFEEEYRLRRHDGEYRWVHARAAPVPDADGRTLAWTCALTDVTERRSAEEKLRVESSRKDDFIAMLGHELRNPLAPMVTATELLKRRNAASPEIAVIDRQLGLLRRLVDDLLDVARVSRGRITLHPERLEVAEVVRDALDTVEADRAAKGHPVTVAVEHGLAMSGDRVRLVQVLTNLLANAIRYSGPGTPIEVSAVRTGADVEITVRDEGPGMPPDLLSSLFEPFVQGVRPLDRSQGGLGLGLSLVLRLTELHGGSVSAHSDGPGKGSTFRIRLPTAPESEDRHTPPPAPPATPRRRVLVVEDNADARELLAQLLRLEGHEVSVAADGPEALARAAHDAPDVVLLDIGLPGMDGYEVARRLKPTGARLVALTGYGQESDRQQAFEAGFDAHVTKPVDPDRLLELLGA